MWKNCNIEEIEIGSKRVTIKSILINIKDRNNILAFFRIIIIMKVWIQPGHVLGRIGNHGWIRGGLIGPLMRRFVVSSSLFSVDS